MIVLSVVAIAIGVVVATAGLAWVVGAMSGVEWSRGFRVLASVVGVGSTVAGLAWYLVASDALDRQWIRELEPVDLREGTVIRTSFDISRRGRYWLVLGGTAGGTRSSPWTCDFDWSVRRSGEVIAGGRAVVENQDGRPRADGPCFSATVVAPIAAFDVGGVSQYHLVISVVAVTGAPPRPCSLELRPDALAYKNASASSTRRTIVVALLLVTGVLQMTAASAVSALVRERIRRKAELSASRFE